MEAGFVGREEYVAYDVAGVGGATGRRTLSARGVTWLATKQARPARGGCACVVGFGGGGRRGAISAGLRGQDVVGAAGNAAGSAGSAAGNAAGSALSVGAETGAEIDAEIDAATVATAGAEPTVAGAASVALPSGELGRS